MVRIFRHYVSARLLLVAVLETLILVIAIRLGIAIHRPESALTVSGVLALLPIVALGLGLLIFIHSAGLYRVDLWKNLQYGRVGLGIALLFVVGVFFLSVNPPQMIVLEPVGLVLMAIAIVVGSFLVRFAFHKWDALDAFKPRVLVLGTGSRVVEFAQLAQRNSHLFVVGYVPFPSTAVHHVPATLVLPRAQDETLPAMARKHRVDQIVIAVEDRRGKLPVEELVECKLQGVRVTELAATFEREYRQVSLESISASWIMLNEGFLQGALRSGLKRLFDLCVSTLLLLLTTPVIAVAAVCIFAESGFPVLYRQERVGQGGRVFSMYKLRSMKKDAESDGTPRWAAAKDDRTTRVGSIIRKLRIDELPQLINVLKGEMSFVGPRPERPYFVDQLAKQIPYYSLRHSIKPGITGWAQVCYPYGASLEDTTKKLQYDLYYVKNHALFLDFVILLATVEVVLSGKGAR